MLAAITNLYSGFPRLPRHVCGAAPAGECDLEVRLALFKHLLVTDRPRSTPVLCPVGGVTL